MLWRTLSTAAAYLDLLYAQWIKRTLHGKGICSTRPDVGSIELSQCTIRYRLKGTGKPTVVFVPDPPSVLEHYDTLIGELSPHVETAIFEAPGCGFSIPKLNFRYNFESWAGATIEFLEALGAGPYVLVFPCISAFVAISIARQRPDLISALVVSHCAAWPEMRRWVLDRCHCGMLATPFWGQSLLPFFKRQSLDHFVDRYACKNRESLKDITDRSLALGALFPFATATQAYMTAEPPDALGPADCAALCIYGEGDNSHNAIGTRFASITALLPRCRLQGFRGVGHFPELEAPKEFVAEVLGFLEQIDHAKA
jgi:pimeloyl-ACP methyl ester carboxylesterase